MVIVPIQKQIFKVCLRLSVTVEGSHRHLHYQKWETTVKRLQAFSASTFLLKTLEKLIGVNIRSLLPSTSISTAQNAYMKGKSVKTAQDDVVEKKLELLLLHSSRLYQH